MRQTAANDFRAAAIARRHGMKNTIRIAQEARSAGVPYDLAFALVEKESTNGSNVVGHDRDRNGRLIYPAREGTVKVTKALYLEYKKRRIASGNRTMQGFGPLQLTYWSIQDAADNAGGTWNPRVNLRIGLRNLAGLIRAYGVAKGVERYNGSGAKAIAYSFAVREVLRPKWHRRFNPRG